MPPPPAELFASRIFLGPALRAQPDRRLVDLEGGGEVEPEDDHGGENSGPGSENPGPGNANDDDEEGNCTTAALVPGAVVHKAELKVANGQATFEKVELSGNDV